MSHNSEEHTLKHLPILDGIRGLAVLLVVIYHSTLIKPLGPIDDYYFKLSNSLWIGVDLFFVLSGFLITRILLSTKDSKNYFRSFYARRALRIFPLYYLFIIFAIFIVPEIHYLKQFQIPDAKSQQLWYWLYGSNILSAIEAKLPHIFLGPTWSLAIEEQFYLFWPLVVALCSLRWLTGISFFLILLPAVLRPLLLHYGILPNSIYVFTLTRLDPIATGAFIACLLRFPISAQKIKFTALGLLAILSLYLLPFIHEGQMSKKVPAMIYFGYSAVALTFGCIVAIAATCNPKSWLNKFFTLKVLLIAGKYSYAIYLFNRPLVPIIEKSIFNPNAFILWNSRIPGQIIFVLILFSMSLALAFISWNLYEKWFLELKKYFLPEKGHTITERLEDSEQSPATPQQAKKAA